MDEEYPPHRKALEEGGWIEDGAVIHHWFRDDGYPISFYVVAFKSHTGMITIDCLRVFGGTVGARVQVSVDKRVRNWKQLFGE